MSKSHRPDPRMLALGNIYSLYMESTTIHLLLLTDKNYTKFNSDLVIFHTLLSVE